MLTTFANINSLIDHAVAERASDIHISSNQPASVRINGDLKFFEKANFSAKVIENWLDTHLDEAQFEEFDLEGDVDFAFSVNDEVRCRVSAFKTQGDVNLAMRILSSHIPNFRDLGIPKVMQDWSERQTGLIIVTGPTGSGKSTTLASMVNSANQHRSLHIVTIEDPIEFIFPKGLSTLHQREIGLDTKDFPRAVRAALREDIDILMLGEMRDSETISAALTVAETGHLVFATLHTPSAAQAIDRIIDGFDVDEQPLVRSRLASCLVGVAYQRLLKSKTGGRLAAYEILVANYGVKNLIREGKTHQIPNVMTTSMNEGMQTMQHSIKELVKAGKITEEQGKEFLSLNI